MPDHLTNKLFHIFKEYLILTCFRALKNLLFDRNAVFTIEKSFIAVCHSNKSSENTHAYVNKSQ